MKLLSRLILLLTGWTMTGEYRNDIKKKVLIMAPHTSNWDLFIGLMVRPLMKDKIQFVAKSSLFKTPIVGSFVRWVGGIPVNRSKSTNFVQAVAEEFNKRKNITILMTPEGTRKKAEEFKTGFYYIAKKAKVPIIMIGVDFPTKIVHFFPPIHIGENIEVEIQSMIYQLRQYKGLNPENGLT